MGVMIMARDDDDSNAGLGAERRTFERFETSISVDYASGENFLFSYIQNISEMGIFIRSDDPMPVGTRLVLRFSPEHEGDPLHMEGEVMWINPVRLGENPNPGMGVRFVKLTPDQRERVVGLVRTIAYLQSDPQN